MNNDLDVEVSDTKQAMNRGWNPCIIKINERTTGYTAKK
jgi:hypothetical protein